jgi:hypothetical protein
MDGQQVEHAPEPATSSANNPGPKQHEPFEAQTQWFHVFKTMIDSGDLATLSGSAIKAVPGREELHELRHGPRLPCPGNDRREVRDLPRPSEARAKKRLKSGSTSPSLR